MHIETRDGTEKCDRCNRKAAAKYIHIAHPKFIAINLFSCIFSASIEFSAANGFQLCMTEAKVRPRDPSLGSDAELMC
jgi:hypothetical protein